MSRVDNRVPHMGAQESRICAANLSGITPASALDGYVLIALSETAGEPVLVSDLSRPQLIAVLAAVLAVLATDMIGGE
jgi:hypothetical protein